jgi:hypothetical protein
MPARASLLCSLALVFACGGSAGRSQPGASAASSGGERQSAGDGARREPTWEEYYVDVERRARRSNGYVMWFNPPRLSRRTSQPVPAGAPAPAGGAPLSGPGR